MTWRGERSRQHLHQGGGSVPADPGVRRQGCGYPENVHCPFCRNPDSRVVDSRTSDDGFTIRRRRQCPACSRRFSTVETASLSVTKRSGVSEPFSRAKVISGVRKACQGRPVTDDQLALLAQEVEETVRQRGQAEIDAHDVGLAILQPLQELDVVAYLRFASVYRSFESLEDFESAIARLRAEAGGSASSAGSEAPEDGLPAGPAAAGTAGGAAGDEPAPAGDALPTPLSAPRD